VEYSIKQVKQILQLFFRKLIAFFMRNTTELSEMVYLINHLFSIWGK